VLRGGSWNNNPVNCRVAYRNNNEPDWDNDNIGFRLVASLSSKEAGYRMAGTTEQEVIPFPQRDE
jgi:Sulfatase-modifying factor enzyme 1